MKKLTQIVSLLSITSLLALLPPNALTASAEEPTTFSIAYVEDKDEWHYQEGAEFDPDEAHYNVDEIGDDIRNGDLVVVYGNNKNSCSIEIPVYLSNLTIMGAEQYVVVSTNGVTDFFAIMGSVAAVNGDIQNAYLYDNARVTFNNNVGTLDISADIDSLSYAYCAGTVGHAIGHYENDVHYEVYNVAAGKFEAEEAKLKTDAQYYSTTPGGSSSGGSNSGSTGGNSASEYDDVPKTGEFPTALLLLGIAVVCFAGSYTLKRA